MESYSLEDALDYVKLYPDFADIHERLLELKKWLTLTGELKKLAKVERMLAEISPWNCINIEKEMKSVEVSFQDIHLPKEKDLHNVNSGSLSADFLAGLVVAMKRGNKTAADIRAFFLAHNSKGEGAYILGEDESMGSTLDDFLSNHKEYLGHRSQVLQLLNTDSDETFTEEEIKKQESSCPEIRDARDIHVLMDEDSTTDECNRAFVSLAKRASKSSLAKYGLGLCYWNGIVVDEDEKKAKEWFQWAASEGCCSAQNRLNEID